MTEVLDKRILEIGLEIGGQTRFFSDLAMIASGTKYANALQDECTVKITNLSKQARDYLATVTSPFTGDKRRRRFIVRAGRVSTGLSTVYIGDIVKTSIGQPPDITLEIKTLTGDEKKGDIVSKSAPAMQSLKAMATSTANDLGVSLDFQATDKQLSSASYTGSALKQINQLADAGPIDVYLDGNTLVVKDQNVPLTGRLRKLSKSTGMIGVPEWTEQGVKVRMLWDAQTTIGGAIEISSGLNSAFNGLYVIYKLSFELTNRDTPWYITAEGKRI